MGNKQSCLGPGCCFFTSQNGCKKINGQEDIYTRSNAPFDEQRSSLVIRPASFSNLQHISEREPEDNADDPSNHPTRGTLFLQRSKSEIIKQHHHTRASRHNSSYQHEHWPLPKKYSSCSTIYLDDSTVSLPNLKNTIKTVALAIYFHIRNRDKSADTLTFRYIEIFDEQKHPLTKDILPNDYDIRDPEHKVIYKFIRTLFYAAQLTAECAIVTLVYLERLLTYAEIIICPSSWKRIVLGAILLASKVWDDQAVWNVDFCQILKDLSVEDMNDLERQFLEFLQFNINVPSSVYAKYYFDLRALANAHDLGFPLEPLGKERALKLEAMSNVSAEKMKDSLSALLRRSTSLDGLTMSPRFSKAIIS